MKFELKIGLVNCISAFLLSAVLQHVPESVRSDLETS
jgi:hypothetical protein